MRQYSSSVILHSRLCIVASYKGTCLLSTVSPFFNCLPFVLSCYLPYSNLTRPITIMSPHNLEHMSLYPSQASLPHPLDPLSQAEFDAAHEAVLKAHDSNVTINFLNIFLEEPNKNELRVFLIMSMLGT